MLTKVGAPNKATRGAESKYHNFFTDMDTDSFVFAPDMKNSKDDFDVTGKLLLKKRGISQTVLLDSICLAKGDRTCDVSYTTNHFSIDSDANLYIEEAMIYV